MQTTQARRTYDHRIKQAILQSEERDLFPELEIPQSTIRSWVHRGLPDVVTSELLTRDRAVLISEIDALRQRTALLAGVVGLLVAMLRVSKSRLDYERYADGASKAVLLRAVAADVVGKRLASFAGSRSREQGIAAQLGASSRGSFDFEILQLAPSRGWLRPRRPAQLSANEANATDFPGGREHADAGRER